MIKIYLFDDYIIILHSFAVIKTMKIIPQPIGQAQLSPCRNIIGRQTRRLFASYSGRITTFFLTFIEVFRISIGEVRLFLLCGLLLRGLSSRVWTCPYLLRDCPDSFCIRCDHLLVLLVVESFSSLEDSSRVKGTLSLSVQASL